MFYCHTAPREGGQTPICDMRKVGQDVLEHRHVLGDLIDEGVRYYRTLSSITTPSGSLYSWEKIFATSDKRKVEQDLKQFGYQVCIPIVF